MAEHRTTFELFYDGAWHPAPVYTRDGLKYKRGTNTPGGDTDPAEATMTLDNRSGAYAPKSALSALRGKIGQNTKGRLRVDFTPIVEDFEDASLNVTVTNAGAASWARTNTQAHGGTWSFKSGSIGNNQNTDAIIDVPTGATSLSFWYKVSSEQGFDLFGVLLGADVALVTSGEVDWTQLTLDVRGVSQVTFRYIKDSSTVAGLDAAFIDDLEFDAIRLVGEVASWKPQRAIKGDAWTPIELAGVLRRIGRGKDPLRSALYRATVAANPVAYWPMEDGAGSTFASSGLSDTKVLTPGTLSPTWANDSILAGSASLPQLIGGKTDWPTILTGDARGQSDTAWTFGLWFKATMDTPALARVVRLAKWGQNPTASRDPWTLNIFKNEPTATYSVGVDFSAYVLINTGPDPFDGNWHQAVVSAEQDGADVRIKFYVDGVLLSNVLTTTPDYTLKSARDFNVLPATTIGFSIESTSVWMGHLAVFDRVLTTGEVSTLYQAGLGYVGETAAARFSRFCLEEGITGRVVGVPADSAPMGAQRIATFLDHLDEMARTDDASIFETRYELGLTMRTGASKTNQAPDFTVSYLGQIVPTLVPVFGDEGIRNDVTARNPNGSFRRVVQETGPHNVQLPEDDPQGVGRYQTSVEANTSTDGALSDVSGWRVHLGTNDGTWYAVVTVDLDAAPGLITLVNALDIGDVLAISELPEDEALDTFEGVIIGIEEDLPPKRRLVTFHLVPNDPYRVGLLALTSGDTDPFVGHLETDDSTTRASVLPRASSFQVDINAGPLWTTTADDFPFDVIVGGQRVTIASISGASSPQTFNVAVSGRQVLYPIAAGESILVHQGIILVP